MTNKRAPAIPRLFTISFIPFASLNLLAGQAMAQGGDKECEALMKQIDNLVDRVAEVSERNGKVSEMLEGHQTDYSRKTNQQTLETGKSTLRKNKLTIANLAEKLCVCCAKKPEQPADLKASPTPSTTSKVTNVLRTIGSSVSIGIGGGIGGGGHDHHGRVRGEDRTRTADKVRTDNKPHSTGKTVTSACKCHPCTCSPCNCH